MLSAVIKEAEQRYFPTVLDFVSPVQSPCTWNYNPSHLSCCGNALGLSCSLAQALMPVERAADLSDAI